MFNSMIVEFYKIEKSYFTWFRQKSSNFILKNWNILTFAFALENQYIEKCIEVNRMQEIGKLYSDNAKKEINRM